MKLGFVLGYSGADMTLPIEQVLEAERLGFDSVWSSEAYGSDAVTPAAWVLARTTRIKVGTAIMQMPARRSWKAGTGSLTASHSCARASTSKSSARYSIAPSR